MNKSRFSISTFLVAIMFTLTTVSFISCELKLQGGFTTSENLLLDANGNEFVMRGINNPHAWYMIEAYDALEDISAQGINCVRVVWDSKLPTDSLDIILQKCIDLKMIPMVELHDATGDTTASKLYSLAEYFVTAEMKSIIKKYEHYILLNIANEWGVHETPSEYWRDAYEKCITLFRNEGIESVIVIDASGWGQKLDPILEYGQHLIDFDPLHNILYSVHMYGSWNDAAKIDSSLRKAHELKLPLIVGEFGYNYNEGENNLGCKVDHQQILKTCAELNMGYLAWSWTGNNKANQWLDMVEYNDWKTPTYWGKEIFDSEFGIVNTAKRASVFE